MGKFSYAELSVFPVRGDEASSPPFLPRPLPELLLTIPREIAVLVAFTGVRRKSPLVREGLARADNTEPDGDDSPRFPPAAGRLGGVSETRLTLPSVRRLSSRSFSPLRLARITSWFMSRSNAFCLL